MACCCEIVEENLWVVWCEALGRFKTPAILGLALVSSAATVYYWAESKRTLGDLKALREDFRALRRENCELKSEMCEVRVGTTGVDTEARKTFQINKRMCAAMRNLTRMEGEARAKVDNLTAQIVCLKEELAQARKECEDLKAQLCSSPHGDSNS